MKKYDLGTKQYYPGDILQRIQNDDGSKLDWRWGQELIGVNNKVVVSGYNLWYRPLKNHLKHFYRTLREFLKDDWYDGVL